MSAFEYWWKRESKLGVNRSEECVAREAFEAGVRLAARVIKDDSEAWRCDGGDEDVAEHQNNLAERILKQI